MFFRAAQCRTYAKEEDTETGSEIDDKDEVCSVKVAIKVVNFHSFLLLCGRRR